MCLMGDLSQLRADAEAWEEWAAVLADGRTAPQPGPLPPPWVVPDPLAPRLVAAWGGFAASVEADPRRIHATDAWAWEVAVDGVVLDCGWCDWLDQGIAATLDALPPDVADGGLSRIVTARCGG